MSISVLDCRRTVYPPPYSRTRDYMRARMGGVHPMILMMLLSELTRLEVRLVAAAESLSNDLRQAMTEHKAALMRYASLPYVVADGVGILTGNRQEQDITLVAPERKEAWHYKIGVMSLW